MNIITYLLIKIQISGVEQQVTELEKIGLIPRSIVRMLDRFYYQIYLGTAEPLVKQFRFSKYLLLTSVKSLFVVLFIPFFINIFTKIYIFKPLVEYFWDTKQTEIFLNYELQEKAFTEIRNFEEKIYFDHLLKISEERRDGCEKERTTSFEKKSGNLSTCFSNASFQESENKANLTSFVAFDNLAASTIEPISYNSFLFSSVEGNKNFSYGLPDSFSHNNIFLNSYYSSNMRMVGQKEKSEILLVGNLQNQNDLWFNSSIPPNISAGNFDFSKNTLSNPVFKNFYLTENKKEPYFLFLLGSTYEEPSQNKKLSEGVKPTLYWVRGEALETGYNSVAPIFRQKTRELAEHYNKESISALTNLLADFMGLIILLILLVNMKMSLMNTTAFLSESFFSLKDSKKAFLMLLFTDLLVGFHSPRGWEVIFHFLFEHFGLPENHNIIFLLVGTFPVLLDALFKYWIFRHLNRHSPATVATFQAMVE